LLRKNNNDQNAKPSFTILKINKEMLFAILVRIYYSLGGFPLIGSDSKERRFVKSEINNLSLYFNESYNMKGLK